MATNDSTSAPRKLPFSRYLLIAALLLTFGLGIMATRWYYGKTETVERENSTVLLERIKAVAKLVTVEGYFSEIYDYQDYYGYDLSFFRKKALIRVKAKVSMGYDLEKMKLSADAGRRVIVMEGIPPADIISIEHDLDYYDVTEGLFNSFSTEDMDKLNANAKEFIRRKALESELVKSAAEQRNALFETMSFMAQSAGWALEIKASDNEPPLDSLQN